MKGYIAQRTAASEAPPEFQAPGNIVFVAVNKTDGTAGSAEEGGTITEAFISGTQPSGATATPATPAVAPAAPAAAPATPPSAAPASSSAPPPTP
jgi:hypothetical protein